MKVQDEGSIVLLQPDSDAEREWLEENTDSEPYQWLGPNLAVEWRYAAAIINGMNEEGFNVVSR